MVVGGILGPVLIAFAVRVGLSVAATVLDRLVGAIAGPRAAGSASGESFATVLRDRAAAQTARMGPSAGGAPLSPAAVPQDVAEAPQGLIRRLATEDQVHALALGTEAGKSLPPPGARARREAERAVAAYRRVDPALA